MKSAVLLVTTATKPAQTRSRGGVTSPPLLRTLRDGSETPWTSGRANISCADGRAHKQKRQQQQQQRHVVSGHLTGSVGKSSHFALVLVASSYPFVSKS